MERLTILVVDDELVVRESLAEWLREDGHEVEVAPSGEAAVERAEQTAHDVYFLDLKMPPGMDGIETMKRLKALRPDAAYVIITAYATVDTAVEAMKLGADEYLVKPCNPEEISMLLTRMGRCRALERENAALRERLEQRHRFHGLVSRNERMRAVFDVVDQVAPIRSTVLVEGESGTGKELVARAIHDAGERAEAPFVVVSCAARTGPLLESELFGHERGAFTGALQRKIGRFELANGGTIFLDEVGDISPKLQMDLLRVLQERTFCRVGGNDEISVDVRVIAATNRDLRAAVSEGRFREDLFYRLNVINIRLPPLRQRKDDIPLLAQHFMRHFALEFGKDAREIDEDAMARLLAHDWPGNVRELENAVARALAICRGHALTAGCFDFLDEAARQGARWDPPTDLPLKEIERRALEAVLTATGGNVSRAAAILQVDRSTIYEKMKRYGIDRD